MAKEFLEMSWGNNPLYLLTETQLKQIKEQSSLFYQEANQIDEITANDLDLNNTFIDMNATLSGAGDFVLYHQLFNPCLTNESLSNRTDLIKWALNHPNERKKARAFCFEADKRYNDHLLLVTEKNLSNPNRIKFTYIHYFLLIMSILLGVFVPDFFILFTLLIIYGIFRYFAHHSQLSTTLDSVIYALNHIELARKLSKLSYTGCEDFQANLKQLMDKLRKIHRPSNLDYFNSMKIFSGLMNWLTQGETLSYDKVTHLLYENRETVKEAIIMVGRIDAAIAIASHITYKDVLQDIHLEETTTPFIMAKDMIHPLIKEAISNDVDLHEHHLITGSNATGKSSYLKMIALNALMAQAFGFTHSKTYHASFLKIYTSMALGDSIMDGESYFVTEVKSLKRMLDKIDQTPSLCIIDEVLRGTNTQERIAASCEVLKAFANKNCICLSATHDVELTYLLEDTFKNGHFQEILINNKMTFDYHYHEGRSQSRNAIALLNMLHYDPTIVSRAEQNYQHFEKTGQWPIL